MSALIEFEEDFVLLLEAGFVAVSQMDEDSATKLFHAAQILRKGHTAPQIGLAAIALYKLETKKSIGILEEILKTEPGNHRACALLGISYLLSNKNIERGEALLKQALAESDDPPTRRISELWLEVLEKSIRKSDSPLQPRTPEEKVKAAGEKS